MGAHPISREAQAQPAATAALHHGYSARGHGTGSWHLPWGQSPLGGSTDPGPGGSCRPSLPGLLHPVFPQGLPWGWGHRSCLSHSPHARGSSAEGPLAGLSCIKFCDLCSWPCVRDCSRGGLTPQKGLARVGSPQPLHLCGAALCPVLSPSLPSAGGVSEHEASLVLLTPPLRFWVVYHCPGHADAPRDSPGLCAGSSPPLSHALPQKQRGSCGQRGSRRQSGCAASSCSSQDGTGHGCSPGMRCSPPSPSSASPFLPWGPVQLSSKSHFSQGSPAP